MSDDLGPDPTLEEILADSEDSVEDVVLQDSGQFQETEEKLPPAPTEDYETTMIEPDTSRFTTGTQDNLNRMKSCSKMKIKRITKAVSSSARINFSTISFRFE